MRKRLLSLFILTYLFLVSFSQQTKLAVVMQEKTFQLKNISLPYIDDFNDLEPVFHDRKVLGMGEATHGTREFFLLKSRLFAYLAESCQFKLFGIEADYGRCMYINDFVLHGKGTIDSAVRNLSVRFWHSEELKDLIAWMRTYNSAKPDTAKLRFYGFDMQGISSSMEYMAAIIHQYLPMLSVSFNSLYTGKNMNYDHLFFAAVSKDKDSTAKSLNAMSDELDLWCSQHSAALKNNLDSKMILQMELARSIFKQAVVLFSGKQKADFRDSCMAKNIKSIVDLEKEKIFVWAHNGHITFAPQRYINFKPMGAFLKEYFNEEYYNIGFVFNEGKFMALKGPSSMGARLVKRMISKYSKLKMQEIYLPPSPKKSLGNLLSQLNIPTFFIDLKTARSGIFTDLLYAYNVGAVYQNISASLSPVIATKSYDGLIFVDKTTSTSIIR
jgi:erythromycin esterase